MDHSPVAKTTPRNSGNQPRLRTRARVDNLSHLAATGGAGSEPTVPEVVRDIAESLVRFDADTIINAFMLWTGDDGKLREACKAAMDERLVSCVLDGPVVFEFAAGSQKYFATLSAKEILAIVENPAPPNLIQNMIRSEIDYQLKEEWSLNSFARDRARGLLNEFKRAAQNLVYASLEEALSATTLRRLKQRLELLEPSFNDLAHLLTYRLPFLDELKGWDDIGRVSVKPPASKDSASPAPGTKAFPDLRQQQFSTTAKATLSFLVPVVCLLSCVPAALAWTHASPEHGRATDSGFFQLVAGTAMQLLNIFVLVYPTVFHGRLARAPWLWTWMLAGTSTVCTVLALPLYTIVAVAWSSTLSFAGAVAQTLVMLQLIQVM